MHFTPALNVGGRIAAFEEVVVELVDDAGAGLVHFAIVRSERRTYGRVSAIGREVIVQHLMGHIRLALPDAALDFLRYLPPHGTSDVAVDKIGATNILYPKDVMNIPAGWCSQTAAGGAPLPAKWCMETAQMVRGLRD